MYVISMTFLQSAAAVVGFRFVAELSNGSGTAFIFLLQVIT